MKLTPEQQEMICAAEPEVVKPIPGGWGRQGWTLVDQDKADLALLESVLTTAWKNVAPKSLLSKLKA
ncbi:MAG: MmcQ/YjbR family DNA-binding protein [Proteobacteria bacterium]|nr:MmcQ/YjbR family DNA-binding protein [Pseudomonadota bacterium]